MFATPQYNAVNTALQCVLPEGEGLQLGESTEFLQAEVSQSEAGSEAGTPSAVRRGRFSTVLHSKTRFVQ